MSKFSLVCLAIAVCAIGSCLSSPLMNRIEADGAEKCKGLCKLCDCIGFYCGEECICECNNVKVDRNLNCVEKMQVSSENMKAPFEILIQGPSSDRFVRSLMAAEESSASQTAESTDSRLTFSVHQPETKQSTAGETPTKTATDADTVKVIQRSCRAEDSIKKDEKKSTPQTANFEPKTNEDSDSSAPPTLRSKRQSGDAPQPADGSIGEAISTPGNPDAQPNDPKVGSPLGALIAARVGIPAALGLGHLGLLHHGLRIHNAAGLHHALLPLRHVLHHAPLIPLLGAANPNADGEPVGQENQNGQAMPASDSVPPQAGQNMNAGQMFTDSVNQRIQNFQNMRNRMRQQIMLPNQGPAAAAPMGEQPAF